MLSVMYFVLLDNVALDAGHARGLDFSSDCGHTTTVLVKAGSNTFGKSRGRANILNKLQFMI